MKFMWSPLCQSAFENVKSLLCLNELFKIQTDASQVGAGVVLLQEEGILINLCVTSQKSSISSSKFK